MGELDTWEAEEKLIEQLRSEIMLAQLDYATKKRKKNEPIDVVKMRRAISSRKKLRMLSKKIMAMHLRKTNILSKPAIDKAAMKLEQQIQMNK